MQLELKAVHFNLSDEKKELIEKKLHKLDFAQDYIVDLHLTLTHEKKTFKVEGNVHFKWGSVFHVTDEEYDLEVAIEKFIDRLSKKTHKEKDKIQDHSGH